MLIFKTMEKSEFPVLIKDRFLMGKILLKQSNGLISVILTLLGWKQRLRSGMLTLNAVIQAQMMLNIQVIQIRQLSRKTQKKLHKFVLANRKLKLREIAEELKISDGSVFTILHEHLSMRKLCSKCVPRLLAVDQKQQCDADSERFFATVSTQQKRSLG